MKLARTGAAGRCSVLRELFLRVLQVAAAVKSTAVAFVERPCMQHGIFFIAVETNQPGRPARRQADTFMAFHKKLNVFCVMFKVGVRTTHMFYLR